MKNQSRPKTRLSICMDSRLKKALLETAALKQEKPARIITQALTDYLEQRRAGFEQPEVRETSATRIFSKQKPTNS
jgi:hypothetical protein